MVTTDENGNKFKNIFKSLQILKDLRNVHGKLLISSLQTPPHK